MAAPWTVTFSRRLQCYPLDGVDNDGYTFDSCIFDQLRVTPSTVTLCTVTLPTLTLSRRLHYHTDDGYTVDDDALSTVTLFDGG